MNARNQEGFDLSRIKQLTDPYKTFKYEMLNKVKVRKGQLILVAGCSGVGKTHFLAKMSKDAKEGKKLFVSLELSYDELQYVLSNFYSDEEKEKMPMGILACKTLRVSSIKSLVHEVGYNYIFIDSPENIMNDLNPAYGQNTVWQNEGEVFNSLDFILEKSDSIIITTSQIDLKYKEIPSMSGMRGSQIKVHRSDVVVILYDDKFRIDKSRNRQVVDGQVWKSLKNNEDKNQMKINIPEE